MDVGPASYISPSPWLQQLIDKTLRVTTTDTRLFVGQLKCTDRDKNLILAQTHEYRQPNTQQVLESASHAVSSDGKVTVDLKSRYIGLVVIPGHFIVKIEVEDVPEPAAEDKKGAVKSTPRRATQNLQNMLV